MGPNYVLLVLLSSMNAFVTEFTINRIDTYSSREFNTHQKNQCIFQTAIEFNNIFCSSNTGDKNNVQL